MDTNQLLDGTIVAPSDPPPGNDGGPVEAPTPLRASVYVVGVTATGQGIGPTRVPRDQVVATVEQVRRNGYLPIVYVGTHADRREGDFLADPDAPNAVALG